MIHQYILKQRLRFDNQYEEIASKFCNLQGAKKYKTKEGALLSNWYEGYLFTALLAISRDLPREEYVDEGEPKANKWSFSYLEQYKYVISRVLEMDGVLTELGVNEYDDLIVTIENEENPTERILSKLKIIVDQLSNAGLKYLNEKYQEDPTIFDRYDGLKELMLED